MNKKKKEKKRKNISCYFNGEMNYSTFCLTCSNANPNLKRTRKSNVYNSFFLRPSGDHYQSIQPQEILNKLQSLRGDTKTPTDSNFKTRDTLSFEFAASIKPLTFHIYLSIWKSCVSMWCANKQKEKKKEKEKTCEEILACEDIKIVEGDVVWKFLWSCHKSTAPSYCTLDSECGLFRSLQLAGYCCSINICNAGSV